MCLSDLQEPLLWTGKLLGAWARGWDILGLGDTVCSYLLTTTLSTEQEYAASVDSQKCVLEVICYNNRHFQDEVEAGRG